MSTPLGDFLRARRDATRPEELGLPVGSRRRAPGLRRSELAALAGISVEYLVRIEQGRDRNPSPSVVTALADALRLDAAERDHLRNLAKTARGGRCAEAASQPRLWVRPTVLALLEQLEPGAALVINRLGDVLAHTDGFDRLARPSGLLDPDRPNLTRYVFTDRRSREAFPDWDAVADERAFDLWHGPAGELATELRAELAAAAGEEFSRRSTRHTLPPRGVLRWAHPQVGELRLEREVLELPAADASQLLALLPADDETAARLDRLRTTTAPTLRAVR